MKDRREFVRTGLVGIAALAAGCSSNGSQGAETLAGVEGSTGGTPPKGPVILSTWEHGLQANAKAWDVLQNKGSVLDAVEQGVMIVESDFTNRSVGLGGTPDRDGHTTLDACIQDHEGKCGAVAFLERIEHPISVARAIMERTPHVMLVGQGAHDWALANGFTERIVNDPKVRAAYEEWLRKHEYSPQVNRENLPSGQTGAPPVPVGKDNHDTIGLVGIDANGRMAGSCTTSGMAYKIHGRVGDSPIIGAGLFVDGEAGAACATGTGELVIRTAGSHTVVELMRQGVEPEQACREAVKRILKFLPDPNEHQVGFLALRKDGRYGAWAIQKGFNFAIHTTNGAQLVDANYSFGPGAK